MLDIDNNSLDSIFSILFKLFFIALEEIFIQIDIFYTFLLF